MIIRITTSLSKKTKFSTENAILLNKNTFCDWSVQEFKIKRSGFLLITNSCSLYSVIANAKDINDTKKFTQKIQDSIKQQLCANNLEDYYTKFIEPYWDDVIFATSLDRSTISFMQSMIKKLKMLGEQGVALNQLSKLATTYPIKSKDFKEPIEIFREMKNN
jgi:hypothetical protein